MKKIIKAKEIKKYDVMIAIDISHGKINYDNLKVMLDTFAVMVENYNYTGNIILFDSEIRAELNMEDVHDLTKFNLIGKDECDYRSIFNYANDKVKNEGWDIFRIFCITDGYGIFPENTKFQTTWITGQKHGDFPFGELTII